MRMLKIVTGIAIAAVIVSSCRKSWLEDYTEDPTRPIDVTVDVLLPSAQVFYVMSQSDVIPRLTGIFTQQMTGTDRQSLAHNRYAQIGESDFDVVWGWNGYAGGMYDLKLIIDKSEDSPHYSGVARIMMAQYLGLFTDIWGDIPYNEALQGSNNLNPGYQTQQQIYTIIQNLLDQGIADVTDGTSARSPGGDDLYFAGDLSKWEKFAWSLKARHHNHLSKKAQFSASDVLNAVSNGFTSNADDAQLVFATPPNSNPWYQFNTQRQGYITQYGYMYDDLMIPNNDPRVPFYRSADSTEMPFYGSPTSPVPIMTYAELKFIEAEVQVASNPVLARMALEEAIRANMDKLGVSATDRDAYIANLPLIADLELVMNEKYIAMFGHYEAWTDWRRTGFPAISVFPGANLPEIPRRLPYPETERLYNSNFIDLQGSDAFLRRHWWDE